MQEAHPEQQGHAPVVEALHRVEPVTPAAREEQEPGPEQHREDRDELAVGQDGRGEPDPSVRASRRSPETDGLTRAATTIANDCMCTGRMPSTPTPRSASRA